MRRTSLLAAVLTLTVLIPTPAQAGTVVVDRQVGKGDYAVATAGGNVSEPNAILVRVNAKPNQMIDLYWTTTCGKGSGAGSKSGDFAGVTPITRKIKMSYSDPDSCTAAASGQLSGSGKKIIVTVLAKT